MSLKGSRQKLKDWLAALIFVAVIIVFVMWDLLLNPQYVPLFLGVIIVALSFVAVMLSLPKLRRRLIEGAVAYHVRSEELGGWLHRYRRVAVAAIATMALIFPIATKLLPSQYIPYFVLALVIVNLVAGSILIGGLARVSGKTVLLVLAVLLPFVMGIVMGLLFGHS